MVMNRRPFKDVPQTSTDDQAYLMEARSIALLRIAPVILIAFGLGVGVLSMWIDPDGERLIRLAEMVIAGALGSLTSAFSQSGQNADQQQINVDNTAPVKFFEEHR